MQFVVALLVYHRFAATGSGSCMHSKTGFGRNKVSTDRAAAPLTTPYYEQLLASLSTVEHLLALALLKVIHPVFIVWIGLRHHFLEPNNLSIRDVLELCEQLVSVATLAFKRN